jgi:hypothetical protein
MRAVIGRASVAGVTIAAVGVTWSAASPLGASLSGRGGFQTRPHSPEGGEPCLREGGRIGRTMGAFP